jgi:CHRD domain
LVAVMSFSSLLVFDSCSKDDNDNPNQPATPTVVKTWDVPLKASYVIPAPNARTDSGTAKIELLSDNSLRYNINVNNLASGDVLGAAALRSGDVVAEGPVLLDLNAAFTNGVYSDTLTSLRQSLVDSLQNSPVYLTVQSTQQPEGVVRGQLDKTIEFAADLSLSGTNVVPPVATGATGTASIRLTADKTLYSNISATNLDAGDSLTTAGLYIGAAGATGTLFQQLAATGADFGTTKTYTLSDELITQLKNAPIYLNVYSGAQATNGLLRGQLR